MKSTNRWQGLRSIRLTQNTSRSTKVLAKVRHSNTQPSLGLKDKHQKSNGETLPICMMTLVEHTSAWRLRLWPQALLPGVFYIKECTNVPGFRGVWMGKEKRNSCCIQQWLSGQPKKKKKGICKPERPRMKNSGPSPEVRSLRWEKRLLVWGYGFYPVKI